MILVKIEHVYVGGGCAPGALKFLKRHKLDYRKFFKDGGLPVTQVEATGDAMALKICRIAREQQ